MDEKRRSPIGSARMEEDSPRKERHDIRYHGDGLSQESGTNNNEDYKYDDEEDDDMIADTVSSINDSGIENLASSSVATTCFSVENEINASDERRVDGDIDRSVDDSSSERTALLADSGALNQASSCGSELSGYTTSSMELPVYTSSDCASVTRDEYRSDSFFNVDEEDEIRANSSAAVVEFLDERRGHSSLEDSTTQEIKNLEDYIDKMMVSVVDVGSLTDAVKGVESSTAQAAETENIVAQNLALELCAQVPGFKPPPAETVNVVSAQITEEMRSELHDNNNFVSKQSENTMHTFESGFGERLADDVSPEFAHSDHRLQMSDIFQQEETVNDNIVAQYIAEDIVLNHREKQLQTESSSYDLSPTYTIAKNEEMSALIEMYSSKPTDGAASTDFTPPADQVPFAQYCLNNIESGNFDQVPSPDFRQKKPGDKSFVKEVKDALTNHDLDSVQRLMENVHDKDEARWMILFDMLENQHVQLLAQQAQEHHNSLKDLHSQMEEQRQKLTNTALTYQQRLAAYSDVLTDCKNSTTDNTGAVAEQSNLSESPVKESDIMSSSPVKSPNIESRLSSRICTPTLDKFESRSSTKIHAPTLEKYEARISPIRPLRPSPYAEPFRPAVDHRHVPRQIDLETSVMKALNFPPRSQPIEGDKPYSPKNISPRSAFTDTRYHPRGGNEMYSHRHHYDLSNDDDHHPNDHDEEVKEQERYSTPRNKYTSHSDRLKSPRNTWSGAYRISKTQTSEPLRCFSPVSHSDTISTDELFLVIPGPSTVEQDSIPEIDISNTNVLETPDKEQDRMDKQESPLNTTFTLTPGSEQKDAAEIPAANQQHTTSEIRSEDNCSFINSSASSRMHLREKHARHMADLRSFYEAEISELKDQLHAIQETNTESHNLRQRLLEREMEEKTLYLEKRLKASKEHSEQVGKHLQELQNEVHEKQRRIWELEYLVDDTERRYNQSQTALDAGKLMNEQVSRLLKEKDAQIAELQAEKRRLQNAYDDAQRVVDDYEKVRRERRSAQTALSNAEALIFDTKSELSEYKSRVAKMEIEQKRMERENDMLHKRLNQARHSDRTQEASHIDGLWSDFSKRPKSISDVPYSGRIASPLRENLRSQTFAAERAMTIFSGSPRRSNRSRDEDAELRSRVAEVLAGNKANKNLCASPTKLIKHDETPLSSNRSTQARQTNGIVEKITTETSPPTRDTNYKKGDGENKENELHIDLNLLNVKDENAVEINEEVKEKSASVNAGNRSEEVHGALSPEPRLVTSPRAFAAVRPTVSFNTPTSSNAFKPISLQDRRSPLVSELPTDTDERWKVISSLEKRFDELQMEKRTVEAALSHIPVSGARANRQSRVEKERLEEKLDQIDKDLGSLRMTLKRYHVLKSTI
ncbi:uncharacterized protein LOC141898222 [Tubulanus polymorphus]|uniref:uncharacterized protein LOC141898222 n=1 Tax=Tubulanus polymorphus TaxID=672921 RepID=UPI003DA3BC72